MSESRKHIDLTLLSYFWGKVKTKLADLATAAPSNFLFDGKDLSTVFENAAAFEAAIENGDFSKIRVGDYWPVTLNGSFRDYGAYTVPSGTAYFTDEGLATSGGTTTSAIEGSYHSATAVKFKVGGADVYCAIGDCLDYFARTCSNAILKLEIGGINPYWRYGDSGNLTGNKNHVLFISRDCLPFTLRMRKANEVWEVDDAPTPWIGTALYRTLNDPEHGVIKLIEATELGAYVYGGPNGKGMRYFAESKKKGATSAGWPAWQDRGKLFLPLEREIWGTKVFSENYSMSPTVQLPIFADTLRHISKGIGNGASRTAWWSASSFSGYSTYFCFVSNAGLPNYYGAVNSLGAPVCFLVCP